MTIILEIRANRERWEGGGQRTRARRLYMAHIKQIYGLAGCRWGWCGSRCLAVKCGNFSVRGSGLYGAVKIACHHLGRRSTNRVDLLDVAAPGPIIVLRQIIPCDDLVPQSGRTVP